MRPWRFDNQLYHYGVKGMEWHKRRYRNYDGTLTAAGKKRYAHLNAKRSPIKNTGEIPVSDTVNYLGKVAMTTAKRVVDIYLGRNTPIQVRKGDHPAVETYKAGKKLVDKTLNLVRR